MEKPCLIFRWYGRFAHFLWAEASTSAPSYPVPPRTTILGLLGAILGLEKDSPQRYLEPASIAVAGGAKGSHWHGANMRKDAPAPLPYVVKAKDKGTSSRQRNTIIKQEWLIDPEFTVYVSLPFPFHQQLVERIKTKGWFYQPSLGLSEMLAEVDFIREVLAISLPFGEYLVGTVFPKQAGDINLSLASQQGLSIQSVFLPCYVTPDRKFTHALYMRELRSRPVPLKTDRAWKIDDQFIVWMEP